MEKLYDTHIINLLRIGKSSDDISNFLDGKETNIDAFFMLDYFNLLLHKRLEEDDKQYSKFLGIDENFTMVRNDSISDKLLSLYTVEEKEHKPEDVFGCLNAEEDAPNLSDTPFLGLIQIMINPKYYKHCGYKKGINFQDQFLMNCEQMIHDQINIKFDHTMDKYTLFRALTSGNFYLVMRSSSMENIYKISYIIDRMAYQHEGKSKKSYKVFSTRTHIGIEFSKDAMGNYRTFSEKTMILCKEDRFAIRLSCCNSFQSKLLENAQGFDIKGVFGKYDFLLKVTMREFAEVYPYLCKHFFDIQKSNNIPENEKTIGDRNNKELLILGLEKGYLKVIHENALVYLNADYYEKSICEIELPRNGKKIIKELLISCRFLEKMEQCFTTGRRSFLDSVRAIQEMIIMYSSLRLEADTYINWNLLCNYLTILNKTVKVYARDLLKHKEDTGYQQCFVMDLKSCANAIHQYIKFLQSINQQTDQAPQYEILTRVDSEMLLVAYMEYMNQFMKRYYLYYQDVEDFDKRPRICPIIYPDVNCSGVEVELPFSDNSIDMNSGKSALKKLMICRVPSFEYFGRFYNLLPLITHEMSHHIRILPRKIRNEHLLKTIFHAVTIQLVHIWLVLNDEDSITYRYGLLEKELADQLSNDFYSHFALLNDLEKDNILNYSHMDDLIKLVVGYFNRFYDQKNEFLESEVNFKKSYKEKLDSIAKMLLYFLYRYDLDQEEMIKMVQELLDDSSMEAERNGIEQEEVKGTDDETNFITTRFNFLSNHIIQAEKKKKATFEELIACISLAIYEAYNKLAKNYNENSSELKYFRYLDLIEEVTVFNYKMQRLYQSQEEGLHRPINKKGRIYMSILKDYCEELKKLNYISFSFIKLTNTEQDNQKYELQDIKELENHLKKVARAYYDKRNYRYVLLDSRLNHLMIKTGLTMEKPNDQALRRNNSQEEELLLQSLYQAMNYCQNDKIRRWAEDVVKLYRETYSDIIMCRTLGFSPFGYFKVMFITISDMMKDARDYNPASINIKRVRLVLAVLLKSWGYSCLKYDHDEIVIEAESVCEATGTYCQSILRDIKPFILKELHTNNRYKNFREDGERYINHYFEYVIPLVKRIFESIADSPWSMLSDELNKMFSVETLFTNEKIKSKANLVDGLLKTYDYVISRVKILYEGLSNVMFKDTIKVNKDMFYHMLEVYQKCNFIQSGFGSKEQLPIEAVRQFYNSVDPGPKNFSSNEKLDYMINFVENYYYINRFEYDDPEVKKKKEGTGCGRQKG